MAREGEKRGILPQIIVAVVVALMVGGTSPWWWDEITGRDRQTDMPPSEPRQTDMPPSEPPEEVPSPELFSPADGAMLDNGRTDRLDDMVWEFNWPDVAGATRYHLYVIHSGSLIPVIDRSDLTQSAFRDVSPGSYIADTNRLGWSWKVRAEVGGVWTGWSPVRKFGVEPVNTDPPSH